MTDSTTILISQTERIKRYGIECIGPAGDGILFRAGTWRPGGEYVQKLIVRNVSNKVKKLKYKLPATRYFSLAYPEEIILSPGIFKELDVIFRPVEYEPYDDSLYIKMLDGIAGNGFHVPVRATIDKLILTTPEGLDMGYCPTHQITTISFNLVNTGEVDAPYEWDVPDPFMITPAAGTVSVGEHHEIIVRIRPEDASVFVAQAVCHVGKGVHAIIPEPIISTKLSAIAKYTYISLSEPVVSFEEVVSGTIPETQEVLLKNTSVVPAEFSLVRFDADRDEVFDIYPKSGVILPQSEITIRVNYNARAMGCYSLERYAFRTPGNCDAVLTCKGLSMPPKVTLTKDASLIKPSKDSLASSTTTMATGFKEAAPEFSLNFRDVELGKVETRIFHLRNDSQRDTPFSIIGDDNGIFKFFPKQGIIPALFKQFAITVVFKPPHPINYYRRFFVLIGDALPLFYDCLGTGFIRAKGEIKEQRPAPLRHAHVQAFRNRSVVGAGVLSPDELDKMYDQDVTVPSNFFAQVGPVGTRAMSITSLQRPVTRTGESVRTHVAPAHEFFVSDNDARSREITINKSTLDFDYTPHNKVSAPKIVTIYNHTHSKVSVQWEVPIVQGLSSKDAILNESNRDKDIITEDRAMKELYRLQAFEVTPLSVDINPGDSQTFEISFCPKQSNRNYTSELEAYVFFKNQRTFRLTNDHSLTPPWCLTVLGQGHTFRTGQLLAKPIMVGGCIHGGKLVFPCAFQGESIYETFMVRNTSNLPCTFKIEMGWQGFGGQQTSSNNRDDVFCAKPSIGDIAAYDFVLVCVRFSPQESRKITQLLRLYVNGDLGGKLLLEGCGATPYITLPDVTPPAADEVSHLIPPEIKMGVPSRTPLFFPKGPQGIFYLKPTCVGLSTTREFRIKNASRLPLRYRLSLSADANDICTISPVAGILKGNEEAKLTISFAPRKASGYEFKLTVLVYPIGGKTKRVLDANQPGPADAPELLQSMSVQIVGEGDNTALVFDPQRITADVRLVNTSETHAIYLENVSESDLSYRLLYKEEFEPDAASLNPERTISRLMPLTALDAFGLQSAEEIDEIIAKNAATEAVGSVDNPGEIPAMLKADHSLFCEQPKGKLPARSRTRVIFTYNPRKAGLFEFLIYAQIRKLDPVTGEPMLLSNDEAALLRVSQDQGGNEATLIGDDFDAESFALMPLMSNITARAAFPKLLFEDIRAESDLQISDIDSLWTRFSLSQINYDLSIPMTHREVMLNEQSTPDVSEFAYYKFDFSPAVMGSPEQSICIQLRNSGYLTTAYHIHLPNEKTLELEAWCDEEEPSEELNRLVCIIEELKLFTIEPREGVLQPGECCTLRVSYHHTSLKYEGLHNLPVQMKLSQGKQFCLDLTGRTLPQPHASNPMYRKRSSAAVLNNATSGGSVVSQTPSTAQRHAESMYKEMQAISQLTDFLLVIVCPDATGIVRFLPVPIGLDPGLAPMQRLELINVSGVDVRYEVDMEPIEDLIAQNYHLPLVRLVNPTGTVPAQDSVFLEWYFYPLEARTYDFTLNVKYISTELAPMERGAHFGTHSGPGLPSRKGSASLMSVQSRGTVSRSGSRVGSRAGSRLGTAGGVGGSAPPPIVARQPTQQTVSVTVHATGYDPRDPKPVLLESYYAGGLPPVYPLLQLPAQTVCLTEDLIDFKYIPQQCVSKRITFLRNTSATTSFEFVVDESSCVLCIDGLLSVNPLVGRIGPGQSVPLEFAFAGYAQPMAFNERLKLMIREIIRGKDNKRSGVRDALMKKIKTKKTTTDPHESVVARPTFSRSAQLELNPIPDGLTAKLPCTIGENGEIVTNANHLNVTGLAGNSLDNAGDSFADGGQSQEMSATLDNNSFRGTGRSNRIVEIDVQGDRSSTAHRQRSLNVGFVQTPSGERGALGTSHSNRLGSAATTGGESRGGMFSRGDAYSSASSRGSNRDQAPLLGVPTVMIIRLRGDVFPIQTMRDIIERNHELRVMDEFVVPEDFAFIPPVGKKFFDQEFIRDQKLLRSKSKVNISFVKGRDQELRETSQLIADELFKSLLNTSSLKEYCKVTLSGINPTAVDIPHSSVERSPPPIVEPNTGIRVLPMATTTQTGVYFSDIQASRSLLSRLVIELKHLGYQDYYTKYKRLMSCPATAEATTATTTTTTAATATAAVDQNIADKLTALDAEESVGSLLKFHIDEKTPTEIDSCVPMQWIGAGDDTLLNDELSFVLKLAQVKRALAGFGISKLDTPQLFDSMMEALSISMQEVPAALGGLEANGDGSDEEENIDFGEEYGMSSRNPSFSRKNSQVATVHHVVNIAVLLKHLPDSVLQLLDKHIAKAYDDRRRRRRDERRSKLNNHNSQIHQETPKEMVQVTEPHTGAVTNIRGSIAETIGELAAAADQVKENIDHMTDDEISAQQEQQQQVEIEVGVEESKAAGASADENASQSVSAIDTAAEGENSIVENGDNPATGADDVPADKLTREPLRPVDLALRNKPFLETAALFLSDMMFDILKEEAPAAAVPNLSSSSSGSRATSPSRK